MYLSGGSQVSSLSSLFPIPLYTEIPQELSDFKAFVSFPEEILSSHDIDGGPNARKLELEKLCQCW